MVIPRFCNNPFVINEHQLIPVSIDDKVYLMSVQNFYNVVERNHLSLIHEDVELSFIDAITIEPYIIGLWLCSNDYNNLRFSKKNVQTMIALINFIDNFDIQHNDTHDYIVITDYRVIGQFYKYNLFTNPRIPGHFKYNNR